MKNTFLILLSLALAPISVAGETATMAASSAPIIVPSRIETQPFSLTLKPGLMHTSVSHFSEESNCQNVPSLLFGGSFGFNWDLLQKRGLIHSVGCSIGIFTGNEELSVGSHLSWKEGSYQSLRFDTNVLAIPLTVSYDLKKDFSDSLSVYAGIRTGAMIRKTSVDGHNKSQKEGTDAIWNGVSSTKILPMLGLGAGMQMYISDKWSLNLSYDFVWTFGKDCDRLNANAGTGDYYDWFPKATSEDHRYYGTISFGVTRSF